VGGRGWRRWRPAGCRPRSAEPLQLEDAVVVDDVEVADVVEQPELGEQLHALLAQAFDVHRPPRGEVLDAAGALERAVEVGAPWWPSPSSRVSGPPQRAGAVGGELPAAPGPGAFGQHRPDHLGDDVAGLAHDDGVAGTDVFGLDLILVVEGGHPTVEPPTKTGSSGRRAWPCRCARPRPRCRGAWWCAPRAGTCRRWPSGAPWT
jgi:hypothetical protein